MTWFLALLGLAMTAFGGWLAVDPASSPAAHFPPLNEHLIHDSAAAFLAFGVGLLVAARVTSWRAPVLGMAAVWNGLHLVSHIVDVDRAVTREAGVSAIIELASLTVLLTFLAWRCQRTANLVP